MSLRARTRTIALLAPLTLAGVAGACGARTGSDLYDHDPTDAGHDTRRADTYFPIDSRIDTFFGPDTFVLPDTFTGPDTLVPDTFVPDTFVPDTFVPDTFVIDTGDAGPPVEVLSARSMSLGDDHTCVVLPDRTVKCWGLNANGQLGDGTTVNRLRPTAVPGVSGVLEIVAGGRHNCVRNTGGTVSCWGWNERGQLGDGTKVERLSATSVPGLTSVVQIAGGHWHTCVLIGDGTARCWGENASGQLGDGTAVPKPSPVVAAPTLSSITRLAAGCEHTCAIMSDRTLQCWGNNAYGQIGGPGTTFTSPRVVAGATDVADVSLGCYSTCWRTTPGAINCIGRLSMLGFDPKDVVGVAQMAVSTADAFVLRHVGDTVVDRVSPLALNSVPSVIEVAAGAGHACARQDKTLWCAGYNHYGELGDGTLIDHYGAGTAVKVPLD